MSHDLLVQMTYWPFFNPFFSPKVRFRRRTFHEPNLINWITHKKSSVPESIRNACFNWPLQKIPWHTIMLFFCHPKFCISIVFSFSWDHFNSQQKLKTILMQNFGVTNKEHSGMLWYFWSGQFGTAQLFFSPSPAGNFAYGGTLERLWFRDAEFFMYRTKCINYYNVFCKHFDRNEHFLPFELSSMAIMIGVWINSAGLNSLGRP